MLRPEVWDGGAAGDGGWRAVARDRHLAWRRVEEVLRRLEEHGYPAELSGRRQRYEIFVAAGIRLVTELYNIHQFSSSTYAPTRCWYRTCGAMSSPPITAHNRRLCLPRM